MGAKQERQGQNHLSHREKLQIRADEMFAHQKMGLTIQGQAREDVTVRRQLNLDALLVGTKRFERARTDSEWLLVLMARGVKPRKILKMIKKKDKISRKADRGKLKLK